MRGLHMALNFWFWPPTEPSFAAPYAKDAQATFEAAFRKQLAAHWAGADAGAVDAGAVAVADAAGADAAQRAAGKGARGGARKRRA